MPQLVRLSFSEYVFKSDSLFEHDIVLKDRNANEGWEFCEEEYDEFDED